MSVSEWTNWPATNLRDIMPANRLYGSGWRLRPSTFRKKIPKLVTWILDKACDLIVLIKNCSNTCRHNALSSGLSPTPAKVRMLPMKVETSGLSSSLLRLNQRDIWNRSSLKRVENLLVFVAILNTEGKEFSNANTKSSPG